MLTAYSSAKYVPLAIPARKRFDEAHPMFEEEGLCISAMVVDDNASMRALVAKALRRYARAQIRITAEADNGSSAVEIARKCRPDLVFMDIEMPHMSGLEAARRIRDELPHTQVVILSFDEGPGFESAALRVGAVAYVAKWRLADDLDAAIDRALAHLPASNGRSLAQMGTTHPGS